MIKTSETVCAGMRQDLRDFCLKINAAKDWCNKYVCQHLSSGNNVRNLITIRMHVNAGCEQGFWCIKPDFRHSRALISFVVQIMYILCRTAQLKIFLNMNVCRYFCTMIPAVSVCRGKLHQQSIYKHSAQSAVPIPRNVCRRPKRSGSQLGVT